GGVAASPRKWREASLWTPPGWCSLSHRSEHHPVLAVMRGGKFAILKIVPSLDSSAICQSTRCLERRSSLLYGRVTRTYVRQSLGSVRSALRASRTGGAREFHDGRSARRVSHAARLLRLGGEILQSSLCH